MLQSIRDRLTGPLVWVVIGLISIPFAFWGIQSFRTGTQEPPIAKVGDEEISSRQFEAAYQQRYQQFQALLGDQFRPELIEQGRFRESVLGDLVQELVLRQHARSQGYRSSDSAVFDYLSTIPAFQIDGHFSADNYRAALAQQGLSPASFEAQVRDALVSDQLRQAVVETAFVTANDAADAARIRSQMREIAVAVFDDERYRASVSVNDEQVAGRYERDRARFRTPERVKLEYVQLDRAKLVPAGDPGDDVLRLVYDAEAASRFSVPETLRARHLLVAFGADKDAARAKAEALLEQIRGGADFETLAKENSDDPGSAPRGGDLGEVQRGAFDPDLEAALFEAPVGDVRGPVETDFGWHLVRVDAREPARTRPFEEPEVRRQLLDLYRTREADLRFHEQSEQLEQLAFENAGSLQPVASALKLTIEITDWVTRSGGAGITADPAVNGAAFSAEVLQAGENSRPLPIGGDRLVVLRKAEYEASREPPLEDVADTIRSELTAEAIAAELLRLASEAGARVAAGEALPAVLEPLGVTVSFEGIVGRTASEPRAEVVEAAFQLPRPAPGKMATGPVKLSDGDLALLVLKRVVDPPPPTAGDPALERERAQLRDSVAGAEFASYRKSIEKVVDVKILQPVNSASAPAP